MELHKWISPGSVDEALFKHYKGSTEVVRELSREFSRSKNMVLLLFWWIFWLSVINIILSTFERSMFILIVNVGASVLLAAVVAVAPREYRNDLGLNASYARDYVLLLYNELGFSEFQIHSYEQVVSMVHENLFLAARAIANTDNPVDEEVFEEDFDRKYQIYSRFDFVHSREYYFGLVDGGISNNGVTLN